MPKVPFKLRFVVNTVLAVLWVLQVFVCLLGAKVVVACDRCTAELDLNQVRRHIYFHEIYDDHH
jgi:hypothetical protein